MTGLLLTILLINAPIKKIDFDGNKTIPSGTLRHQLLSRKGGEYNDVNITYDINGIKRQYESQGFFYTEVATSVAEHEDGVRITFTIIEGVRKPIDILVINGTTRDTIDRLLRVREGDYFRKLLIRETEDRIENFFKDRGYPFADVTSFILPDSAILIFTVEKGLQYYTRNIEIEGLTSCRPSVLYREMEIKKGEIFNKKKLVRSQQNIYSLGFFSTIDVELQRYGEDSLDLIFNVRELKSRILNFGIGLSTPLDFIFSFGIEELNMFNWGHRFQVRPQFQINIDKEWIVKLEGRYTIPHITSMRLALSVLPFLWYENLTEYNLHTRGSEFRLSKVLSEHILFSIANQYKYVELFRKTETPLDDSLTGITNSVRMQVLIDNRDDFFNPKRGVYIVPMVQLAGGIFGGVNDFIKYEIENRLFVPVFKNTLAQRLKVGYLYPLNGVAFYELYYLGGQYTVRGYNERSIGPTIVGEDHYGRFILNYSIEARFHLPLNFGLVAFLDCGYVANNFDLTQSEFLKIGTGAGLRYYTPIGPVRLDIGFPLDHNDRVLYLGIYHIF